MSLPDLLNVFLVVFGIGLVIFVHEAGHFLAARWCGARVEVFSLGFGPRLFGWQRGDTIFQVAVVPLGGYVKVAGEYMEGMNRDPEPGTLGALNVPQRFLYYSGGVIMNVIFALVVLPLVMFAGLPTREAVIGAPTVGMPAWTAGVPAGSRVVKVNDDEIVDFQHLVTAVAINGKSTATLEVLAPGATETTTYELTPEFDDRYGFYRLGLPGGIAPDRSIVVEPGSGAAEAGLQTGARLIRVIGQPEVLPIDVQLARAFDTRATVTVVVADEAGVERTVDVAPEIVDLGVKRIGVGAVGTSIAAMRDTGPAAALRPALGLAAEDDVLSIGGTRVWDRADMRDALLAVEEGAPVTVTVRRAGEPRTLSASLPEGIAAVQLLDDVQLQLGGSARITVTPGTPAERAGMRDGDQVVSINGTRVSDWPAVLEAIQREVGLGREVEMEVWRDTPGGGAMEELDVALTAEPATAPDYGFGISAATTILRAETLGGAVAAGFGATQRFFEEVWTQLRKMLFSSEISTKNLGGIISISVISFDTASQGLPKLFFFLAILSINLAIINLLPIPILDGGHLLFLLIEGIKGSPVSERTFGYSQVVGLVMIMSLMVYVTYQDIVRWFIEPR